jgi:uncharacterized protein (TIGR00255 family)
MSQAPLNEQLYLTKLEDSFIFYENMVQSMTGYGSASNSDFTVEIRSLNHRFIDISLKMPPYMSRHEIPLRNILKERFRRGRLDVSICVNESGVPGLKINKHLARNIYAALRQLQEEFSLPGDIGIETLTGYRELLVEEEMGCDVEALYSVLREAASNLEQMRLREGNLLVEDIGKRLDILNDMNGRIKSLAPDEVVRWREKFTERLKLMVESGAIDNNRIIQEAALMAEKLDISEETNRIENHVKQFVEILDKGDTVGKQLDFLLQEINREVNTLAYKSGDYSISRLVVEMKTEVEKIREQIQNIQ